MSLRSKLLKKLIKRTTRSSAQKRALAKAVKASALSRRNSKKLVKLSRKIKTNSSALRALKKGTKTVYRIQNKRGEGPLVGKHARHYIKMPRSIPRGVKVSPVGKHNRLSTAILKRVAPKGTAFEEINFSKLDKFGFDSVKQSQRYFSKAEQAYLKTYGFNLTKINNVKISGATKTQVTFRMPKGLNKTAREAAKLTAKYEKLMKGTK